MNLDQARAYLLAKPEASETFPFGADVAVMKVGNKMFATLPQYYVDTVTVLCGHSTIRVQ